MTASVEPSVDEMLSSQEYQYHIPNFVFSNVKPIGAERKIGQSTNTSIQILSKTSSSLIPSKQFVHPINMEFISKHKQQNNNFEISSSPSVSTYDYYPFSSMERPLTYQTNNELESSASHHHHLSTSDNSIMYLPQSSFIQQNLHRPCLTQLQTVKTTSSARAPQAYSTSRFFTPHLSQQTRSIPPVFTTPFQCTRERFQVNSIGRPILRANNYSHLSKVHASRFRR